MKLLLYKFLVLSLYFCCEPHQTWYFLSVFWKWLVGATGLLNIIDGLAQDCGNYSTLALELPQSCANSLISVVNTSRP